MHSRTIIHLENFIKGLQGYLWGHSDYLADWGEVWGLHFQWSQVPLVRYNTVPWVITTRMIVLKAEFLLCFGSFTAHLKTFKLTFWNQCYNYEKMTRATAFESHIWLSNSFWIFVVARLKNSPSGCTLVVREQLVIYYQPKKLQAFQKTRHIKFLTSQLQESAW